MKHLKTFRIVFIILSVVLVVIPALIVFLTGNGLGSLVADILISSSILAAICAIMIGVKTGNKSMLYLRISSSIGLLIVLLSLWI